MSLAEFEKFYQTIEQKLLYEDVSIISAKKGDDMAASSQILNQTDSVLQGLGNGKSDKEKLLDVLATSSLNDMQKAKAKSVIDEVVDRFNFEVQRLQEVLSSYDSRIERGKKEIKSESETIAEFLKEIEMKEAKIVELLKENKMQREHLTTIKDSYEIGKNNWETDKRDLIPKLEKALEDNSNFSQRLEQQELIISELERQNRELKDLADKRYKSFIQIQEQHRANRSDQVAYMQLQTEYDGMKKRLEDLEAFMQEEEIEYKTKLEKLSELNDNLIEECKEHKKRIKQLEEEKWRQNLNNDINENMLDSSFIKDSIIKLGQDNTNNKSKNLDASVITSPQVNNTLHVSMIKYKNFEADDWEKKDLDGGYNKMKNSLIGQNNSEYNKSLQALDDVISSDNEINLTGEEVKRKMRTSIINQCDFSSQTEQKTCDASIGYNEGVSVTQKIVCPSNNSELLIEDVFSKSFVTNSTKPNIIDACLQSKIETHGEGTICHIEESENHLDKNMQPVYTQDNFYGLTQRTKPKTTLSDLSTLINKPKEWRCLQFCKFSLLSISSKYPLYTDIKVQTEDIEELSIIEPVRKNHSTNMNTSYFDTSQAFIENLQLYEGKKEEPDLADVAQEHFVRDVIAPCVILKQLHCDKKYEIFNIGCENTSVGYYYNPSDVSAKKAQLESINTSFVPIAKTAGSYAFHSIHIINQHPERLVKSLDIVDKNSIIYQSVLNRNQTKQQETQAIELIKYDSSTAVEKQRTTAEIGTELINQYKSQIAIKDQEHQRVVSELHEQYSNQMQELISKRTEKSSCLEIQDTININQNKENNKAHEVFQQKSIKELQTGVLSLTAFKSARKFDTDNLGIIASQENVRGLRATTDKIEIYQNPSERLHRSLEDEQSELQAQKAELDNKYNESLNKMKLDHENSIIGIKNDLTQQIHLLEQKFKKKNQFLETEFNNKVNQLKEDKDQEISELSEELTAKKAELKDKSNIKRQLDQSKIEIDQLKADRYGYITKLEQLIREKEALEQEQREINSNNDDNNEEYKLKLQEQITNNKKLLEQVKLLQEAKRKADNRCIELQMDNEELEKRIAEFKQIKTVDPFEDFNFEMSKQDTQQLESSKDFMESQLFGRSSTLGDLQPGLVKSSDQHSIRKIQTVTHDLFQSTDKSLDKGNKKYRLSIFDNAETTKIEDIKLKVDNRAFKEPVWIRQTAKVKEISNILQQKKHDTSDDYVNKAKIYSYDYINVKKCFGILEIIQGFQNLKNINEWFSDIVHRLNSWTNKKKKLLVITEFNLFIFTSKTSLKRRISLLDIIKLKHSQKNNYIGIAARNIEEEVLETYRKEELILFLKKKMKNLGKELSIVEQTNFSKKNKLTDNDYYNPNIMKKYKPHYTETFSFASLNHQIGYITTEAKEMFGLIDTAREFLCLLTNIGVICFTRKEFKVSDFIPLVGTRVYVSDRSKLNLKLVLCDSSERTLAFNSVNDKNAWYDMLSMNIKELTNGIK